MKQYLDNLPDQRGYNSKYSLYEQLIIFLLHLKHYTVDSFIAFTWRTSKSTIQSIRQRIQNLLYLVLKGEEPITIESPEWREDHSVYLLGNLVTFILDGSEQPTQKPRTALTERDFFSAKKGQHSINILLVISAKSKKILYISPSFPGSKNDNEIVRETRSAWFNLLRSNEWGLGDSIFQGLEDEGIRIFPLNMDRSEDIYKVCSKYRVDVENVFAEMKDFRALKDEIRMPVSKEESEVLNWHHRNWYIVGCIINLFRRG